MTARGLIIAAPASGSGKTLVTAGLLRHLSRRGIRVAAAKTGPDFIDPTFHAMATGLPCVSLDLWSMRPATVAATVAGLGAAAELVLCEGVMGLFDGTGADGEQGSTAELARITGWPVVLVVDVRGQAASVAALLRGFLGHRPDIAIAGVIFNNVAGERHRSLLAAAVVKHLPDLAVFGALAADLALALSSRHLGLVPANEGATAEAVVDRAAAAIGIAIDVDKLLAAARPTTLVHSDRAPTPIPPLGQRIAIACDDAFRFAYPLVLAGWRRTGAELTFFRRLPARLPTLPPTRFICRAVIRSCGRARCRRQTGSSPACAPRPAAASRFMASAAATWCSAKR